MLKLENLTVRYGKQVVIDGLTATLPEHGVLALTGTSGIGKTTLLNVLAGLKSPYRGSVVSTYSRPTYIFQEPRLFPWMTALENVAVVCKDQEKARRLLSGLFTEPDIGNKYPSELSGGMKQRVAIARALAYDSDLLLMDEPFKGLDPETRERVSRFVFVEARGKTVLMVTHDREDLQYADYVLQMEGSPTCRLLLEKCGNDKTE